MAGHDAPTRRDVLAVIAPGAALLMAGIPEAGTDIVIVNGCRRIDSRRQY